MARRRRLGPAQPGYLGASSPAPADPAARNVPPIAQVSGQSAEAAALREVTEGLHQARETGRMVIDLPLEDVVQDHLLRDRMTLERDDLDALKASIAAHGQRIPAEVTPLPGQDGPRRYGLVSGWRRLRALGELHAETGEARFATLRALVRPPEEVADSVVAMIEENEVRSGLSYYERARVVARSVEEGVFADTRTALRTLFATASRAKRSKIGSFLDLYAALDGGLRFPAAIPERLGLGLVAQVRAGRAEALRAALQAAAPATPAEEQDLLTRLVAARPGGDVSRAKHDAPERLGPALSLSSARRGNRLVVTLSGADVDPALQDKVLKLLRDALS